MKSKSPLFLLKITTYLLWLHNPLVSIGLSYIIISTLSLQSWLCWPYSDPSPPTDLWIHGMTVQIYYNSKFQEKNLLTLGACWILGFCKKRVISAFSALRRCKQTHIVTVVRLLCRIFSLQSTYFIFKNSHLFPPLTVFLLPLLASLLLSSVFPQALPYGKFHHSKKKVVIMHIVCRFGPERNFELLTLVWLFVALL